MARGGRRAGAPGRSYSNRSDLNVNRAPTGGLSVPPTGAGVSSAQPTQPFGAPTPAPPAPGSLGTFAPSKYPNQPITHGLPSGPGAGPEALQQPFQPDPLVQAQALLSAIPAVHQTAQLKALQAAVSASVANGTQTSIVAGAQ